MKRALVLGGAACVWNDVEFALDLSEFEIVVACKRIVEHWSGPLDAFASLHPESIADSLRARREKGYSMDFAVYCDRGSANGRGHIDHYVADWAGSSGLYGVPVALHLGADRIVLAGVPMDSSAHFDREVPWATVESYRKGWIRNQHRLNNVARSCSGWTRAFLGCPDEAWLKG
jgi:hypothetical protein